jgi:hypothetical protein
MRALVASIEAEYRRYKTLGERAIDQLTDPQLADATSTSNSIATIVWHLAGNRKSRFTDFLTSDGEKPWQYLSIPPGQSAQYNQSPTPRTGKSPPSTQ